MKTKIHYLFLLSIFVLLAASCKKEIEVNNDFLSLPEGVSSSISISEITNNIGDKIPDFKNYNPEFDYVLKEDSLKLEFENSTVLNFNKKNKGLHWENGIGEKFDSMPYDFNVGRIYVIRNLIYQNQAFYLYFYVDKQNKVEIIKKDFVVRSPI